MNRASLGTAAAFIAGYLLLDWVSYIHPMQQYGITPWNPQPALAIALLMLGGQRWLPAVLAATVAAEWLVRGNPASWAASILVGAVLALGYAAIARALTGRFAIHPGLESRSDTIRLMAVIAVGALGTGILYVAALLASGSGPLEAPFIALVRFWIGDTVGILVTLPFVLMLAVPARRAEMRAMLHRPEMAVHAGLTALALASVFTLPDTEQVKVFYVLLLPLIVVSTRHGLVGAAVATLVIQAVIIVTGEVAGYQALTVFELQGLLIALTVTGLFLGVTVDERRRAEDELRRSMRLAAAGEMAAALAHELNQPLTAVSSYARASQLMAASYASNPELLAQTLAKLVAEAARAADVVRRLRDFFRTGATHLTPVSLAEVGNRVAAALAPRAESSGVAIEVAVAGSVVPILADETQLEVVLRNLLANGIEAAAGAHAPRSVRIDIVPEPSGGVLASVEDSGPGVSAADAMRIFEPFETTRASGMGMGLAISRAIVEAHGGRLWVEPAARGIFRFTLPSPDAAHG
jgi:two-component system, LuxR family, sensor kinase FixL